MKIKKDIIEILSRAEVDGNTLHFTQQLDRKTYLAVAKVITAIGGKWNRSKQCHVFDRDAEEILQDIILTGEYTDAKKEFQYFATPDELAKKLVADADIKPGESCLEPSAGRGGIAKFMPGCDCIELNPENREYLKSQGFNVIHDDFITFEPQKDYDVIVMNPPFCKQQDILHVTKAIHIVRRCVVAVTSASVMWRSDRRSQDFRKLVESFGGKVEPLPENSFKASGTAVNTCKVVVEKSGREV